MLPERTNGRPAAEAATANGLTGWRRLFDAAIVALMATGAAWLLAVNLFPTPTDFGPVAPAWAARVLAIHGAAAMVALLALGAWLPLHVLPRLRRSRARATGIIQLVVLAVLVVTGFGLYYVATESSRPAWSTTHWLAGLALAVSLLVHRRRSKSRNSYGA